VHPAPILLLAVAASAAIGLPPVALSAGRRAIGGQFPQGLWRLGRL